MWHRIVGRTHKAASVPKFPGGLSVQAWTRMCCSHSFLLKGLLLLPVMSVLSFLVL